MECIERVVEDYKFCKNFFNERKHNSNKFINSLKEQFNTKGYLTEKQMSCLRKQVKT